MRYDIEYMGDRIASFDREDRAVEAAARLDHADHAGLIVTACHAEGTLRTVQQVWPTVGPTWERHC